MLEAELLQLVEDDFAAHIVGRGHGAPAYIGAENAEHPLCVAPCS